MWEAPVIRAQQRTRNDFRRRIRRTSPPSGTGGPARPRTPSPYRSRRRAEQPARSPDRSEGCRSGRGRRPRSGLPRIRAPGSAGSRPVSPGMCITTLSPRPMRKRSARPVMVMAARISAVSPRRASSARSTSSRASRDSSLPAVRARGARHSSSARRTTASGRARCLGPGPGNPASRELLAVPTHRSVCTNVVSVAQKAKSAAATDERSCPTAGNN